MGGVSEEREISIQSGRCIARALKQADLDVVTSDVGPDNMDVLGDASTDVFFVALHGRFGEDGQLQQILEDRSLIYTGSGPTASRLAFDKWASKRAFAQAGVQTPQAIQLNGRTDMRQVEKKLQAFSDMFVIKPLRQGSSVGISIAGAADEAIAAARKCLSDFGDCMIEEFIPGREITVSIIEDQALPIIEIRSKTGFYDFHAKYIDERTEFLFDTIDDRRLIAKINAAALDCFHALGCRHFARVDFILGDDGKPYALEVNTIPGFTSHSLLPKAAAKAGISMSDLCRRIVEAALADNTAEPFVDTAINNR